jgi:hypothetical protein
MSEAGLAQTYGKGEGQNTVYYAGTVDKRSKRKSSKGVVKKRKKCAK